MFTTLRNTLFILLFSAGVAIAAEENVSKEVDVTPGDKLIVDVDFGSISVATGADGKVALDAHRIVEFGDEAKEKEYLANAPIVVTKEGNVVTVQARRKTPWSHWHFGFCKTNASYVVHVPKKFDLDLKTSGGEIAAVDVSGYLKAHTSGGKLEFANLEGTLVADTSGGSITLENCKCPAEIKTSGGHISVANGTGPLHARTSGGRIEVHNLSGDADVETSGGGLVLEKIRGKLIGKTSGGSIHSSMPGEVAGDVQLKTSAGSIELAVPANAALDIDARTSAGHVSSELPLTTMDADRQHLRGKLNGGGKSVVLETSGGSITLKSASAAVAKR